MTIAELITELTKLDQTMLVAVWNPNQGELGNNDPVRLIGGNEIMDITLDSQADAGSDNYPLWNDVDHTEAERVSVVLLG